MFLTDVNEITMAVQSDEENIEITVSSKYYRACFVRLVLQAQGVQMAQYSTMGYSRDNFLHQFVNKISRIFSFNCPSYQLVETSHSQNPCEKEKTFINSKKNLAIM